MDQGYPYVWEAGHARNRSACNVLDDDEDDDSHSDDGPLLPYKHDKCRRSGPHAAVAAGAGGGAGAGGEGGEGAHAPRRRSTLRVLVRFTMFYTAMILVCVLMYIPMYSKVIHHMPKDIVAGWPVNTNRDTKIYVQPNNITTLHDPTSLHICSKTDRRKNKLFLLIVVCSSTSNFERRVAIRETWGSYTSYMELTKLYAMIKEKYKNYNYTYDLYPDPTMSAINGTEDLNRTKREAGFSGLLPKLAEALNDMQQSEKTEVEDKRFDDDEEENDVQEFDMNKELEGNDNGNDAADYNEYDYPSNVMKIPAKGYVDTPDLERVLSMLKKHKLQLKEEVTTEGKVEKDIKEQLLVDSDMELDFKLTFLLGLPSQDNSSEIQSRIDDEVERYGDIIQENFIDSYNNLTLKSIMMLKWVINHCGDDDLRYILKTDDDMYINVPSLVAVLRNKSREHDARARGAEYLLAGDLIHGAKPVLDATNKWFSPRYMYGGRVYPRYLSGTGYALSVPAARALYRAALHTPYFHLEDVYITGICALRAKPRVRPQWSFSQRVLSRAGVRPCDAHAHVKVHRVPPPDMRALHQALHRADTVDRCERMRLTQVRRDRLRPKPPPKPLPKLTRAVT